MVFSCHPEPQRRVCHAGCRDASLQLSMTGLSTCPLQPLLSIQTISFRGILCLKRNTRPGGKIPHSAAGSRVVMLNSNSLNAVNGAKYSRSFVKPLYDTYCFSALPQK